MSFTVKTSWRLSSPAHATWVSFRSRAFCPSTVTASPCPAKDHASPVTGASRFCAFRFAMFTASSEDADSVRMQGTASELAVTRPSDRSFVPHWRRNGKVASRSVCDPEIPWGVR